MTCLASLARLALHTVVKTHKMRTKSLCLAAAALLGGVLVSSAQSNVYSLNIVGYVNVPFAGNSKFTLVANPLNTTNNTLDALIKPSLPVGGKVLKWNGTSFTSYQRVAFGNGWSPTTGATATLNPGEGAFVQTPAGSLDITNTFVGEVLTGAQTNSYVAGFSLTGNKIADAGLVTDLGLTNVPTNSKILVWNTGSQSYNSFQKVVFGSGWSPSVPSISTGQGFFIQAASPFDWTRNFTP